MNSSDNKTTYSNIQEKDIPFTETLEKDPEFIKIKNKLISRSPKGPAWNKEKGLSPEFIVEEKRNYLDARRAFKQQFPKRYLKYLEQEKELPTSKIRTDPEYVKERQEKLIPQISKHAPDKDTLTYEEYEKTIDKLPVENEKKIQEDFLKKRPDVAEKYSVKLPGKIRRISEIIKTQSKKTPEKTTLSDSLPSPQPQPSTAPRTVFPTERSRQRREEKRESQAVRYVKSKTKDFVKKTSKKLASKAQVVVKKGFSSLAKKLGATGAGSLGSVLAGIGSQVAEAAGITLGIFGIFFSFIAWVIMSLFGYLLIIVFSVITILFIINSGAYVVPPGGLAPYGGGVVGVPPSGGMVGSCTEEAGNLITDWLASQIDHGSVRLLPETLGSRLQGLCTTPTMIVLHTSSGYDNDEGNNRVYSTLLNRNVSCQLATDTDDTILMLDFYENQVEFAWCANDLNDGGISIEMSGECQDGSNNCCRDCSACTPGYPLIFQPGGPHPCPNEEDLAFDALCTIMQHYAIPWCQIFQHEDAVTGNHTDPIGDEWVDYFIGRFRNSCPTSADSLCS